MKSRRKLRDAKRPVFDSIRKPAAPPAKKMESDRIEEKRHPAQRKTKHKAKPEIE